MQKNRTYNMQQVNDAIYSGMHNFENLVKQELKKVCKKMTMTERIPIWDNAVNLNLYSNNIERFFKVDDEKEFAVRTEYIAGTMDKLPVSKEMKKLYREFCRVVIEWKFYNRMRMTSGANPLVGHNVIMYSESYVNTIMNISARVQQMVDIMSSPCILRPFVAINQFIENVR